MSTKKLFLAAMLLIMGGILGGNSLPKITGNHPQALEARRFLETKGILAKENLDRELGNLTNSTPDVEVYDWLAVVNAYRHLSDHQAWDISEYICNRILSTRVSNSDAVSRFHAYTYLSKIKGRKKIPKDELKFANCALDEAKKIPKPNKFIIEAYLRIGDYYINIRGSHQDVKDCYQEALKLASEMRDSNLKVKAYQGMANACTSLRSEPGYRDAIHYYREILKINPDDMNAVRSLHLVEWYMNELKRSQLIKK